MIALSIFTSIEFYVISAVIAAAILAYAGRRDNHVAARQILLPTTLHRADNDSEPSIELISHDNGDVTLRRHGLEGIGETGAVSLAIEIRGFDVHITERLVPGSGSPCDTAETLLDFMAVERYFINYRSEKIDRMTAFTFHNRPGMHIIKPLR